MVSEPVVLVSEKTKQRLHEAAAIEGLSVEQFAGRILERGWSEPPRIDDAVSRAASPAIPPAEAKTGRPAGTEEHAWAVSPLPVARPATGRALPLLSSAELRAILDAEEAEEAGFGPTGH